MKLTEALDQAKQALEKKLPTTKPKKGGKLPKGKKEKKSKKEAFDPEDLKSRMQVLRSWIEDEEPDFEINGLNDILARIESVIDDNNLARYVFDRESDNIMRGFKRILDDMDKQAVTA